MATATCSARSQMETYADSLRGPIMMTESRTDRLARIKRALEMGMPPLSTEDQRWLFEQVSDFWMCKSCGFAFEAEFMSHACPDCESDMVHYRHTLDPPRKRCETCGGAGYRNITVSSSDWKSIDCEECGGSGWVNQSSAQ